ncbi:MAG: hypothetical protein WAU00_02195 [Caldilinea sp.]
MTDSTITKSSGAAPASERVPVGRLGVHWRSGAARPATEDIMACGLVNAQTWVDHSFWRPAALWAGIAGALSAGATLEGIDWRVLALALILVDVLWGSVWRLAGGRAHLLPLSPRTLRQQVWLPYLQPGSPAARVFANDHQDLWPLVFRAGIPAILLALLVAAVLGVDALALTLIAVAITLLGWTARHTLQDVPVLLGSLMSIGLPWLLIMQQLAPTAAESVWGVSGVLVAMWVLHHWGEMRILADPHDAIAMLLLASGELAICALLILAQAPLWLAGVVLLLLPTWLAIVQGRPVGRRMQPLWLLAMLLSAVALGQVL